ncbi:MAG: DUF4445 domain-containing protein [Deltaproteobacteria bacterium]|nr:DUF4445 domain-containing protein [Deltaproteobacteria bacterium]
MIKIKNINYTKKGIGAAFDIGTTTIVGRSVDLATGLFLGTAVLPNPQSKWGRDVVSRINAVVENPALLADLSKSVVSACNEILERLPQDGGVSEITAAGNPVMEHILLGISPEPLSKVPYKPAFKEAKRLKATEIGLSAKDALLYTFPFIGGFVGGDAVAVALSLGLKEETEPTLAIDIGTNSEIILSANGSMYATSAAAGPAFEGGELKYGMTARDGAIQGVNIEGDRLILDVIGNAAPKGICGSGLIEAVSGLLKAEIIERTGRIKDKGEIENNLANKIKEEDGGNSFVLYRGAKGEVALNQADIRALQVAKSATRAGISMLLKKAQISPGQIKKVYIAGAFGSHLKKEGLKEIGLLDSEWLDNIYSVGDAALDGATLALLTDEAKAEAEDIAAKVKYVSLSGSAHFEQEFIRNMNF